VFDIGKGSVRKLLRLIETLYRRVFRGTAGNHGKSRSS